MQLPGARMPMATLASVITRSIGPTTNAQFSAYFSTLVTPAAGFFLDPSRGQDQIRIACVLGDPDLDIAMTCIERGLDAYRAAFPNG